MPKHFSLVLFAATFLVFLSTVAVTEKTPLYILGLYPFSGDWAGGQGQFPATQLGFDCVNDNDQILPDYEFKLVARNTLCDGGRGTDEMYRELYNKSVTYIMVLGAGCSIVTAPTAQASQYWNLLQLSYSSASPQLSNRALYPMLFRMYPPETAFNVVKFAILKHYGWKRVATIHQNLDLFSLPTSDFREQAKDYGIEIIASESVSGDPAVQLANLKAREARIIIGNFYESMARRVFCTAYKLQMYGENYVWIITGWYSMFWWKNVSDTDCTLAEMREAVKGYFSIDALPKNLSPNPGLANISTSEFWSRYRHHAGANYTQLGGYHEAPYGYDSAWTIATTLHEAEEILKNEDPPTSIANFSYDNERFAKMFFHLMNRTDFLGVSGPVQFTSRGDRKGIMQVEQNQDGLEGIVGIYDPSRLSGERLVWTNSVIWQGDGPPADSLIIEENLITISTYLFAIITTLAVLGIAMALFFLAFNIKHRRKRYIKMSSPNLNNLILVGGILAYISMVFFGIDASLVPEHTIALMCKLHLWCLTTSFSVAFGAMFMKTWRVHRIFTNKTMHRTSIRDHRLYAMIAVLVVANIILFVIWELVSPLETVEEVISFKTFRGRGGMHRLVVIKCVSESQVYFYGVLLVLDGLLLIFGAFLAWETRHVTVPALNDSKYIGMSVYTVVVLCFIGVPVTLVLDDVDANYALLSMFIFFATTLTLCLVFVPKLKARNMVEPKGTLLSTISDARYETDSEKRIRELNQKVHGLLGRLEKRDEMIRELEGKSFVNDPCSSHVLHNEENKRPLTSVAFAEPSTVVMNNSSP